VSSVFLGCFAFGLIFTVGSFLLGAIEGAHIHLPGISLGGGGGGGHHHGTATHSSGGGIHVSPFNASTASAFLAWFGGAGYLLTRYSGFTAVVTTLFATMIGLIGGGIVFLALSRFILPRLTEMRPEDYVIEGTVGRITSAIRRGGTGEIVYTLGGTQQIEGARGLHDEEFERGAEVVIHHVHAGIAYVERWDKFAEQHALPPGSAGTS
jgi:membrane protein implicated in regulation of membrane protease activity